MKEKILVVDDNVASGKSLTWMMEDIGYEVHFADSGPSALCEIREFVPDVVLCDIQMPGMLGYEVCAKMKSDERLQNTLFIAQTGLTSSESKERSIKAGFNHHLVKPVDINALLDLVYKARSEH